MNRLDARLQQLPQNVFTTVAAIDELKGEWVGGSNLSPQALQRLRRSALATSTGASTRIEGAKMSDEEVEKFMRGLKTQKMTDRDEQEVRGYFETLQGVFDNYKEMVLSESLILHLHGRLLRYSDKDERHKGAYKHLENQVEAREADGTFVGIIFETTPAYLTPIAIRELVEWTTAAYEHGYVHPLLVTANFIVEFLKIHPFLDGNGRLSRIMTSLLLLRSGYVYVPYVSHEKIIEADKPQYYIALRRSQGTFGSAEESIVDWTEFFMGVLRAQAREAIGLIRAEDIEKLLSPQQLKVWHYLGEVDEASPAEISQATQVARDTVFQVLTRLMDMKKIERLGLGRATRYRKI
ncbi:MAG: Fic family protein [Candidatus Saccharimonadales bacterium]